MEPTGLFSPLQKIKGVGPKLGELFSKKGVSTIEDALYFVPRDYDDRRRLTPIAQLKPETSATVRGKVIAANQQRRGRQARFQATISDGTGTLVLNWFRSSPYLQQDFSANQWVVVSGEVKMFGLMPNISHPDYEKVPAPEEGKPKVSANFGRIIPVYSETEGLHQKTIRRIMTEVLKSAVEHLSDPFPEDFRARLALPSLRDSFVSVHFPQDLPPGGELSPYLRRIVFEEFFVLQLGLGLKRQKHRCARATPLIADPARLAEFIARLPFALTGDQRKTIDEVVADVGRTFAMSRLVQGDVGSGKTVVAMAGAVVAAGAGHQTALMVPTEILAQQHFKTARQWLEPMGIKTALVVQGSEDRKESERLVRSGEATLVVGTQALFQSGIEFNKLGLVVVDEQHRFGVDQRGELLRKGKDHMPHLLMMTATPIPRTLALTLYGDLDLSFIREKPANRKKVVTRILRDKERPRLYSRIRETVARGEQAYIIYPLVEASEKLDLKSATEMHERLSREVFPDLAIALLHGRMKAEDKESILARFRAGKYHVLISTTVIEVGIDVANATLMVIEHPERLGLSQLHQLRGRIGRGEKASECILVAGNFVGPRLQVMERSDDGFEIAEEDLKIRGPGEFLGTRQSGLPGFRVGHILRDAGLLTEARREAQKILEIDPELTAKSMRNLEKW